MWLATNASTQHGLHLLPETIVAEAARAIEPLCMLWCIPCFLRNEWSHAFKLLT
jgi:hypothetical protein